MDAPEDSDYNAALDEIYKLRMALVTQTALLDSFLELKSFPRGRRGVAHTAVEVAHDILRGEHSEEAAQAWRKDLRNYFAPTKGFAWSEKQEAQRIGVSQTLTAWEWEHRNDEKDER